MDVLILLLFVSGVLVTGAMLLFAKAITGGDFEHGDRLALLPLEQERGDRLAPLPLEQERGDRLPPLPLEQERGDRLPLLSLEQKRGDVSGRGGGRPASRIGGVVGDEIAPCLTDQAIESREENIRNE